MHSLNLKLFTDFNVGAGGSGPDRRNNVLIADSERTNWSPAVIGRDGGVRACRIVACSSHGSGGGPGGVGGGESPSSSSHSSSSGPAGSGSSSFLSRSQSYALLKQQLKVAAKSEDYKEAARIRDSLRSFEEEEPVLRLRRSLQQAIADERFEDAAKYRNELKEISPYSLLKCSSNATTLGIRVEVRSVYIEGRSRPSKNQ